MGDELIASGQARKAWSKSQVPVLIVDAGRRPRWHPLWEGLPFLVQRPGGKFQYLVNAPGVRPYISAKTERKWTWRKFDLVPGAIALTEDERRFAAPYGGRVLVEPNIKGTNGGNKAWIWERWQAVADAFPGRVMQVVGSSDANVLRGVQVVETPSFRHAAAVLAVARCFVGTEGGLHHAAAALGVPAVVLFSEFISPAITGYQQHHNLYHADKPCGSRVACAGCRASMEAITVDEVVSQLREVLG